jgi:outer membrane receptor protein involved in Fe transport
VPDATGQTPDAYRPYVRGIDGFNSASFNYSQTPNERESLWLLGSHSLGESTNLFVEGLFHHRTSAQQAAPAIYHTDLGPTLTDGTFGIPADNYYNPFGVDVARAARRLVEAGNRKVSEDVELWRALIGFEGTIARWTWEVALASAQSDATMVESGFVVPPRFASALGPSGPDDSGRIVCGLRDPATGRVPAANVIPDCVPLNLFGGAGSITQEQLQYVSPRPLINTGTNEHRLAELLLSGPGGRIGGREVRWVLGGDYRREAGSLAEDPLHALEFDTFGITAQLGGAYDARELFADVQLPLLHDRLFATDMALSIGIRWSDFYSFDNHTAWQAGLRWQLAEELTLRANYAEVFRAPTIVELYDPRVRFDAFFDIDPCGNHPTPKQQANCEANGVPGGEYVQGDEGFTVFAGGNHDLQPETGHSFGAGVIYTPVWAQGLSTSIDYFQVERFPTDDLQRKLWRDGSPRRRHGDRLVRNDPVWRRGLELACHIPRPLGRAAVSG